LSLEQAVSRKLKGVILADIDMLDQLEIQARPLCFS
jgi:hypothetical protein